MKILMLNYEFPPLGGGAATVTYNLAKELVRQGHEIDVVTMHYKGLKKVEDSDGIRIYRVRCLRKKQEICYTKEMFTYVISAFLFTLKLTRKKNYDIVHCHFIIPTGIVAYLLKKFRGLPYITTSHGSDIQGYNPERFKLQHKLIKTIWRTVAQNASRVTAVSNSLKSLILESSDIDNISVIYNGQDVNSDIVEKTEKSILLVSRILERKGFQYFLYAIKDLDLHEWEINIVGDGPYLEMLKKIAKDFDLPVKFLGYKRGKELEEIYRRSSIFVFPSAREAFPVVLLEALSYGCAIITTDIASCREVVGDSALFVRTESPEDIREALEKLLNDPKLRYGLGSKAIERLKQFSWAHIASEYSKVYAEVSESC
jgi:glycosyltransferase involved in cell wall biosynthesis